MTRPGRQDIRQLDRGLLFLCLGVLGVFILYPTVRLGVQALGSWDWSAVTEGDGYQSIVNTLVLCLASVVGAGVFGTALAWGVSRFTFSGRNALALLAYLPFTLPPLVGVLSFYYLIGRDGILTRLLELLPFVEEGVLNGFGAILLIHVYSFYVFFYAMVGAAIESMDRSQIEAARSLGAGRVRVFWHVVLPQLRPALLGASLLTFMSSGASFSAPYYFGRGFPVLSVQIFNERSQYHQEAALTLTVVLAVLSLLGIVLFRSRHRSTGGGSKGVRVPIRNAAGRTIAGVAAWGIMGLLLLPHFSILYFSVVDHRAWYDEILPTVFTVQNYVDIFGNANAFAPIRNSLWMSLVAALVTVTVGVPAAYLIGRRRPGAGWVNTLVMIPWALPGTVIAINLIVAFNDPWMPREVMLLWLPMAYFVRSVPMLTRMAAATIEPFDAQLLEAGQSLGASRYYCFRHIVLPLIAPALVAATALVFATSLGEFVASILLYQPGNEPIAVRINSISRTSVGAAFAYSVLLMGLVAVSFGLSRRFSPKLLG